MQTIPVIDIAPFSTDAGHAAPTAAQQIEDACRDIGFMYIRGHGVRPRTISRIRQTVRMYFEQPLETKLRDRITRVNYRGYIPAGFFTANTGSANADNYEGYKLHFETSADDPICAQCDLYGPNRWPEWPAEFKRAVLDYWSECDRVSNYLLAEFANILAVDRDWFLQVFDKPLTNMTLLHYPPQEPATSRFGIHPHKDTDAFTILAGDEVDGLMVRPRMNDEWIDARPPPGCLVVNIGDLLELWSGGYFVSTPHKVVNTSGAERHSFPYFVVPRFDAVVEPLRAPVSGFARNSVHVGDVSREVWRTNWPDAAPQSAQFDLGTLAD